MYNKRCDEVYTTSVKYFTARKWNKCISSAREFLVEIYPESGIPNYKELAKMDNLMPLLELYYTSRSYLFDYMRDAERSTFFTFVLKLVEAGAKNLSSDSQILIDADVNVYSRLTSDELYSTIKKKSKECINIGNASIQSISHKYEGLLISFVKLGHKSDIVSYVLPFLKYYITYLRPRNVITDILKICSILCCNVEYTRDSDVSMLLSVLFQLVNSCIPNIHDVELSDCAMVLFMCSFGLPIDNPIVTLLKGDYYVTLRELVALQRKYCFVCLSSDSKVCVKCKISRYCSTECQVEDWPHHKKTCGKKNDKQVVRPELPKLDISKLINTVEETYKDETWNPFG